MPKEIIITLIICSTLIILYLMSTINKAADEKKENKKVINRVETPEDKNKTKFGGF